MRAASLERWRITEPGLVPGLTGSARLDALRIAVGNARIHRLAFYWQALGRFLEQGQCPSGLLHIKVADAKGRHEAILRQVRRLHESLRGKPVLHLDPTMRSELVHRILPGLELAKIDVAAPHMHVRGLR